MKIWNKNLSNNIIKYRRASIIEASGWSSSAAKNSKAVDKIVNLFELLFVGILIDEDDDEEDIWVVSISKTLDEIGIPNESKFN